MRTLLRVALGVAGLAGVGACQPATLDGFFYDPLRAPAGGYDLSLAVIPAYETLPVTTPDGQTLDGVFIPSAGRRPAVTIIYLHGQNSNLGTSWQRLEYLYPLGYNLVLVDPRGYGKSTGTPTEAGLQIDEQAIFAATLGALVTHPGADPAKVVLYGRSLGSGLAIDLAYRRPDDGPAVLITESAFASIAAFVNDATYVDFPSSFVSNSVWDNLGKIPSVKIPTLLFHGSADQYVDPRYSEELAAAHLPSEPDKTLLEEVPGADHTNVPEVEGLDAYRAVIQDFVDTWTP